MKEGSAVADAEGEGASGGEGELLWLATTTSGDGEEDVEEEALTATPKHTPYAGWQPTSQKLAALPHQPNGLQHSPCTGQDLPPPVTPHSVTSVMGGSTAGVEVGDADTPSGMGVGEGEAEETTSVHTPYPAWHPAPQ